MTIQLNGDTGITTPMYNGTISANAVTPSVSMKNRIINGAMVIAQRGTSAVSTSSTYPVDRWYFQNSVDSKLSLQQNLNSITPPAGFVNYIGVTTTSAYSVGSSDYYILQQRIEGSNTADLGWGTANAQTVTLSFWVRSSLTGTFGGALGNSSFNRSYPFTYTISSANTWEYKTITVAGDTTGTWVTNSSDYGIVVRLGLGVGSTYSGTAGSWQASGLMSATGAVSVVGTGSATWYVTGVQLEVGSSATSFDYRQYGQELALCQRYYQKTYNIDVVPTTSTPNGCLQGIAYSSSGLCGCTAQFLVSMRTNPTIAIYSQVGTSGKVSANGGTDTGSGFAADNPAMRGFQQIIGSGITTSSTYYFHYTATAEL